MQNLSISQRNAIRVILSQPDGREALLAALHYQAVEDSGCNTFLTKVEPLVEACLAGIDRPFTHTPCHKTPGCKALDGCAECMGL